MHWTPKVSFKQGLVAKCAGRHPLRAMPSSNAPVTFVMHQNLLPSPVGDVTEIDATRFDV